MSSFSPSGSRDITSIDELSVFAAHVSQHVSPPAIFLLHGNLGAGKTEFVRRLARCYGVTQKVQSPTFNFMHIYQGISATSSAEEIILFHLDFYRIDSDRQNEDALDFDFWQLAEGKKFLILAEWSQKVSLRWSLFSRQIYAFYFTLNASKQSYPQQRKGSPILFENKFIRQVDWQKIESP